MKKYFISLFIILAVFITSNLFAADPNGTWSSTTGSTIKLWANMQKVFVTVIYAGKSYKYTGWWTRFGDKFSYNSNNGTHSCSFSGSNVINIKNPNGSWTKWTRGTGRQYNQPKQYSKPRQYNKPTHRSSSTNINGLWSSTSGSSVQISTSGQQVFVTLVTNTGQRIQGSGRWLQTGVFDYSIPGYPAVAMATVLSGNKISVSYGGKVTYWNRR